MKFVYASYYLYGLQLMLGARNVAFDGKPFATLDMGPKDFGFDHFAAMVVEPAGARLVVDYGDKAQVNRHALRWSDVYAKINIRDYETFSDLEVSDLSKIVQIGPGFGINQWGVAGLATLAVSNRAKINGLCRRVGVSEKQFFGAYYWARKRGPLEKYLNNVTHATQSNYVFHASQYYVNQAGGRDANRARLSFVAAASKVRNIVFEGGLVAPESVAGQSDVEPYATRAFSSSAYLEKTKQSAVVFNTPAAWSCHGWKLGEFLALGKAIISMPFINNQLPGLVHGENIHFVRGEAELSEALLKILLDKDYQMHLERGARAYFNEQLHPREVVKQLIARVGR